MKISRVQTRRYIKSFRAAVDKAKRDKVKNPVMAALEMVDSEYLSAEAKYVVHLEANFCRFADAEAKLDLRLIPSDLIDRVPFFDDLFQNRHEAEVVDETVKYYRLGGPKTGNLARVSRHGYQYLNHPSGTWVRHERVFDDVHFEASTTELTLAEAKKYAATLVAREPVWINDTDE